MQKCRGVWNKGWQATNFKRWWEAQHRIADGIGKLGKFAKRRRGLSETEVRRKTNEDKIKCLNVFDVFDVFGSFSRAFFDFVFVGCVE
jgi:hypothetical protein